MSHSENSSGRSWARQPLTLRPGGRRLQQLGELGDVTYVAAGQIPKADLPLGVSHGAPNADDRHHPPGQAEPDHGAVHRRAIFQSCLRDWGDVRRARPTR